MARTRLLVALALLSPAAIFAACSSDNATGMSTTASSSSGTGGGDAGTGGGGSTSSSTSHSSSSSSGDAAPPPVDECKNLSDGHIIQTEDVSGIAAQCGLAHLTDPSKVVPCIVDGTKPPPPGDGGTPGDAGPAGDAGPPPGDAGPGDAGPAPMGLSAGCAGCYGAAVACTAEHCLSQCTTDAGPAAPACVTCRETNCDPAFFKCSGLPKPMTDGGADGGG